MALATFHAEFWAGTGEPPPPEISRMFTATDRSAPRYSSKDHTLHRYTATDQSAPGHGIEDHSVPRYVVVDHSGPAYSGKPA